MLIGINGAKGAGKDLVGQHLVSNHGFTRISFAEPLKKSAAALFGVDYRLWDVWKNDSKVKIWISDGEEVYGDGRIVDRVEPLFIKSITAREFLQRYGTESHRDIFGQDFWTEVATKNIRRLLEDGHDVVVTDMRFPNELDAIIDHGGYLWKIRRPEIEGADSHVSEQIIPDETFDVVFWNTGTPEGLLRNVDTVIEESLVAA